MFHLDGSPLLRRECPQCHSVLWSPLNHTITIRCSNGCGPMVLTEEDDK